jgi:hypothetical protein
VQSARCGLVGWVSLVGWLVVGWLMVLMVRPVVAWVLA